MKGPALDFDLLVKGYCYGENAEGVKNLINLFLDRICGLEASPVKYAHHVVENDAVQGDGRVLKIAFVLQTRNRAMTMDEALLSFSRQFFAHQKAAFTMLSDIGFLGFSPNSERLRLPWYRELFSWLHTRPSERLGQIRSCIDSLQGQLTGRMPLWAGAAVLAVSLGIGISSGGDQLRVGARMFEITNVDEDALGKANSMLTFIAGIKEYRSNPDAIMLEAQKICKEFISHSEMTGKRFRDCPDDKFARKVAHYEALESILSMFEIGFKALTLCSDVAKSFVEARRNSNMQSLSHGVYVGINVWNAAQAAQARTNIQAAPYHTIIKPEFVAIPAPIEDSWWAKFKRDVGFISQTAGDKRQIEISAAYKTNDNILRAAKTSANAEKSNASQYLNRLLVIAAFQIVWGVVCLVWQWWRSRKAKKQEIKWTTAANYIGASMRHAQVCEIYLRWTYSAGDERADLSEYFFQQLQELYRSLNATLPDREQCTPEYARSKLETIADLLEKEKIELGLCLGFDALGVE